MVGSLETDSQSSEDARREIKEDTIVTTLELKAQEDLNHGSYSLNRQRRPSTSTSNHAYHLAVREPTQLPSPSHTPSPRSTSPSLLVTGDVSADLTGTLSFIPTGQRYSGTLEKAANSGLSHQDGDGNLLSPPVAISMTLLPHDLQNIPEEKLKRPRKLSAARNPGDVLKLPAAEMEELVLSPESLPMTSPARSPLAGQPSLGPSPFFDSIVATPVTFSSGADERGEKQRQAAGPDHLGITLESNGGHRSSNEGSSNRRSFSSRSITSPPISGNRRPSFTRAPAGQTSPKRKSVAAPLHPETLDSSHAVSKFQNGAAKSSLPDPPSPMPQSIPLPPMSIPTYLQLELSSTRPSPLYIYRPASSEFPYESSKIKFERLLNFLLLPPQLERVIDFGSLACLDAWLYAFTIMPLRFFTAAAILIGWWGQALEREVRYISGFIYHGSGRMWNRKRDWQGNCDGATRSRSVSQASRPSSSTTNSFQSPSGRVPEAGVVHAAFESLKVDPERRPKQGWGHKHRRSKSQPSSLSSHHKADLLQGAVIICSCAILMRLDASRMYHSIRGQAAIKLYVIYSALEVCDKLLSALGQDILECLFSNETLERDVDGRSKILRPLGMFVLSLIYSVVHSTALFYQVITLNVAVNSYSNALITLLISNQFSEIKSTVFKKIEKDNLFQLTCADIVERFQLWLMLVIIACRNIVEMGGLTILGVGADVMRDASAPTQNQSIVPNSFSIFPSWVGEILSPFLLVLGSEMLVDWIKHAYITKFNNLKPAVYKRYLDVLAKDYYTNAFVNQNLVKRLGLPVIPLSCLFIRSSVQTYHMFLATHLPPPIPSTATSLSVESAAASAATTAALEHFDNLIRHALGRSTFGIPNPEATNPWYLPSADDAIAALTMFIFFMGAFFVLLACKLVLGMLLLKYARNRYRNMKKRENESYDTEGKRLGGWGITEVDEDKKRWIYDDDMEGLRTKNEKERAAREKAEKAAVGQDFGKISRYEMVKRIW